ncbi:MAG: polymer-forming cytoskeletal protein [candidate division NC10 bacterium]|nr:polymer-forming cytoskeletal protein [candidate division NC10 bacterium]MCH7897179.1 polymer-forming cytoskeletal protein [candidate division NC10 bacterium]MCZ6550869.1 polymer-forming cytoskeletal protein [candidate division NC10 bacterium]
MALWKEYLQKQQLAKEDDQPERALSPVVPSRRVEEPSQKSNSLIAAGLTVEGKIEGSGHVRIAGRFKGDIRVEGDLTIESGAYVAGEIHANTILVGGEVHGNVHADARVQLMETGNLIGDLTAGSLTVAAGSRMRGKVEFGWDGREANQAGASGEGEAA